MQNYCPILFALHRWCEHAQSLHGEISLGTTLHVCLWWELQSRCLRWGGTQLNMFHADGLISTHLLLAPILLFSTVLKVLDFHTFVVYLLISTLQSCNAVCCFIVPWKQLCLVIQLHWWWCIPNQLWFCALKCFVHWRVLCFLISLLKGFAISDIHYIFRKHEQELDHEQATGGHC